MIRGDEQSQFLVTLPSNACDDVYPNNRPGNYKTRLPIPVDLGEDWEVGLVDVQYPQSWYNFVHTTRVILAIVLGRDAGVVLTPDNTRPYKFPSGVTPTSPTKDEQFQINFNKFNSGNLFAVEAVMRPGHYASVKQVGEALAASFNQAFVALYPTRKHKMSVSFAMDPTNTYSSFIFENIDKAFFYTDNVYATDVLGIGPTGRQGTGTDSDPHIWQYGIFRTTDKGEVASPYMKASLTRAFSVYIYSDIIKSQIVGDALAPLLGVAPVVHTSVSDVATSGKFSKLQYWCFNPTYYMPLRLSRFDTIDMLLCTDEGLEVVFGSDVDKVVCRLHFQRRAPR